ncbi:alpha-L-rhamnosidase [Sphingomonas naasensis]|nr:glycosyl hydrolase family 28 protein [Sphingomonas naasensis]NIJ21061.1 alpha-L-rhamnosidase [Sphingomonas naasensis]
MTVQHTRRLLTLSLLAMPLWATCARAAERVSIRRFGAKGDGVTIDTRAIQDAIDHLAARGGGTVIVPRGIFLSGALFLKPRVNLHLDAGAVIRCTTDMAHFPPQRTRIEGHFEERFTPALINAKGCDGLRISGEGTLDGAGRPIWDLFWKLRNAAPNPHEFPNLGVPRARLALIEQSKGVVIEGVTFRDSQFWNLHLYKCEDVLVRGARFEVPDDYKQAPSSDGIDLDSCRKVVIDGCTFSVTDDCIAAKGTKGPGALDDRDSPPVENIRVRNCHFRRGHHAFACGSEATIVRDVLMENCRVTGDMILARLKLRPDTPQRYEDITFRNITLDSDGGSIVAVQPWSQYTNLGGAAPPQSTVAGLRFIGIKGCFGAFGTIQPNPGQTRISDVLFRDVDVRLGKDRLVAAEVRGLRFENVVVNGEAVSA